MVQWIKVGYYTQEEQETDGIKNGVFANTVHEQRYFAKSDNSIQRNYSGEGTTNQKRGYTADLSIIANPWLIAHWQDVAYVEISGVKWEIQSIVPQHPRYILNVGGIYHETD